MAASMCSYQEGNMAQDVHQVAPAARKDLQQALWQGQNTHARHTAPGQWLYAICKLNAGSAFCCEDFYLSDGCCIAAVSESVAFCGAGPLLCAAELRVRRGQHTKLCHTQRVWLSPLQSIFGGIIAANDRSCHDLELFRFRNNLKIGQ